MNCTRCQTTVEIFENSTDNVMEVPNGQDSTARGSPCSEIADDIGGFAEIAGCLGRLKSSEKQVSCWLPASAS